MWWGLLLGIALVSSRQARGSGFPEKLAEISEFCGLSCTLAGIGMHFGVPGGFSPISRRQPGRDDGGQLGMHRSFGGAEPPPTSAISHLRFGPRGFWPSLSAALRAVCMKEAIA